MFTTLLAIAMTAPATAGYGDVDEQGYPSWAERSVHLWTNAARVDPEAFSDEYPQAYEPCRFEDFTEDEKTPKAPIYYDRNLNDAARFHSQDMVDNNWFAHESSDGTSFGDRMARFYESGYIGENIAYGYPSPFSAMFHGWMCSSGHRANIMTAGWTELGTGVVNTHYTQDFGGGAPDSTGAVAMGVHEPSTATDTATFYADWQDDDPPTYLRVVIDGRPSSLDLEYGKDTQGVFAAEVEVEPGDCHAYYFAWETADGTQGTFPETGSYTYGIDCADGIGWVEGQDGELGGGGSGGGFGDGEGGAPGEGNLDTDDIRLVGCSSVPGGAAPLGALALLGLAAIARRRD
jgi:MYXO-CTERM domain-containing protein